MKMRYKTVLSFMLVAVLMAAGCSTGGQYFGKTEPPGQQRLVYQNSAEPETLDPAKATGVPEGHIIHALFEGLTGYHPKTLEPMAALATHYETNADSTQFTFYLRGHPNPRGTKLPNTDTLREQFLAGKLEEDFSRGLSAPPDSIPARWSDGRVITAHDFVYSWRRVVAPETASDYASLLYYVKNAEEINGGKVRLRDPSTGKEIITTEKEIQNDARLRSLAARGQVIRFTPEDLAVRALDDFTFQVDMRAPTAFFVKMQAHAIFFPVPRHAIEAAAARGMESSWTRPEHMVTSGAFTLREWKPYDKIVLAKNPNYFEADLVALDEITVLPINDNTTSVNLYKAGEVDAMSANAIPQPFIPVLRRDKRDFHITPSLGTYFYLINTKKPPFDNLLLRYALNMATDKEAITEFLGAGQTPAATLVPPIEGYRSPSSLEVSVGGKTLDILSYDPAAARELLAKAGFPNGVGPDGRRLRVEIMFNTLEAHKQIAEIVQQQWRRNLNIEVTLVNQEWKVYLETLDNLHYAGVARRGWIGDYVDPNTFLDLFVTGSVNNGSGWTDPRYDRLLKEANATTDPEERARLLTECEEYLLKAMPFVPIYTYSWFYLRKPYVRGMEANLRDEHPFKYVWIDPSWRPESGLVADSGQAGERSAME
ncbi:MAG TPA: peptide ABC transporter substrate-binding protein [Blastocatellia bacterium]|nr:peptide ABC transporter substrate-binding protein [Blastocatellia bacterium]